MANFRDTKLVNLAVSSVDHGVIYNYDVMLDCILIHASTPITETIQVIFDSLDGTSYDTVLDTKQLSGESDYVYRPAREQLFKRGDTIRITITNANTTGIVGITTLARIKQREE